MFQKDKSSLYSQGKRVKDVPVRKSDRRKLLQIAHDVFQQATTAMTEHDRSMLSDCFLHGDLYQRSVKMPAGKTIDLYYRSPNSDPASAAAAAGTVWPYRHSLQCVWLQMEDDSRDGTTTGRPEVILQIPSLALLAVMSSSLISTVHVPTQVSKFLCRGANLMRAGIRRVHLVGAGSTAGTGTTTTGTISMSSPQPIVAIVAMGNPQPFAVGILQADLLFDNRSTSAGGLLFGPGRQGLGVTIVHCYGDDIWKAQLPKSTITTSAAEMDGGHYGNVGFLDGQLVVATTEGCANDDDEEEEEEEDGNVDPEETLVLDANDSPALPAETNQVETTDENNQEEQEAVMPPEEVLHLATCKALAGLSLKNDLPMKMSTFYAQYVLPNRPAGSTIELKKTRYKKYSVYVQEQVKNGLLMVGPDEQKDPAGMLTSYDRRHPDVQSFVATVTAEKAADASINNNHDSTRLLMVDLYRVPHHFVNKLQLDPNVVKGSNATSDARKNTSLLTLKEVRAIVESYIAREGLVSHDDETMIMLDGPLTDALFKTKQQPQQPSDANPSSPLPLRLSRKDLMAKWQAKMEIGFAMVKQQQASANTDQIIRLGIGKHPVITIEVARRQSKKFVTKVSGLEAFGIDPDAFAKDASHRFGCSSSVTAPQPGGNSSTSTAEVLFQGNLVNELEALLRSDPTLSSHGGVRGGISLSYHLPKNAIAVVLRKGVPARKNINKSGSNNNNTANSKR
jgi:translation initiation factor 2D